MALGVGFGREQGAKSKDLCDKSKGEIPWGKL